MIGTSEKNKIHKAETELMNSVLCEYLTDGNSISLWRLPDSNAKNLIICTDGVSQLDELVLEEAGSGFVFAPFDSNKKISFLRANIVLTFEDGEITSTSTTNPHFENLKPGKTADSTKPNFYYNSEDKKVNTNQTAYQALIQKSIHQIENGQFEKLVPSRSKQIELSRALDLVRTFNDLCALYPNAFISLVSTPDGGTWMGASPELLVSVDSNSHFKTAAVAGTQWMSPDADLKLVAWTQKEIEEQALVSRYIINCFKKIRLREFEEHGPKTWRAGNLVHLKTDFEVDMLATNFPQLGTVMLKLLHPTSAVCGMPREESISFLKENENLDRGFYSGYLGPVNYQNETHLFVNLRCMQWNEQFATFYAGAGVTLDSNPQKEWDETELKMNTLLDVIQR